MFVLNHSFFMSILCVHTHGLGICVCVHVCMLFYLFTNNSIDDDTCRPARGLYMVM